MKLRRRAAEPDDTLVRLQKFQTYVSLARNLGLEPGTPYRPTFPGVGSTFRKPMVRL